MDNTAELYQQVYENSGIGIALVGFDGFPIQTNKALQDILGYTESELLKMRFSEFTHPDDTDIDNDLFGQLADGSIQKYSIEKKYLHKNGSIIYALLNVAMVQDNKGNNTAAIGMVQDISSRKISELRLAKSLEQLQEVSYITTHDLKQPLSNIIGFVDLITEEIEASGNEEVNTYLSMVKQASLEMNSKLEKTMAFYKIGATDTKPSEVAFSSILELAKEKSDRKEKLACTPIRVTPENTQITVVEDEFVLLFAALFKNAVDYAHPDRDLEIQITINQDAGMWNVGFKDNGLGFESQYQDRVFKLFQTLKNSPNEGLGTGLAVAQKVVNLIGGSIAAKTVPNEGTEIVLRFPHIN